MSPPSSEPQYISNISTAIFETLEAGDPDAVWLMQAWQFLSAFWKDDLIEAWLKRMYFFAFSKNWLFQAKILSRLFL